MTTKQGITEVVRWLDSIGFDVGSYHVSLWRAVLIVVVAVIRLRACASPARATRA